MHRCVIGRGMTVGHDAVVLDGAVIGAGSLIGAGALVTMNTIVPPRSLVLGSPAKVVRSLRDEEVEANRANAAHYVRMSAMYRGKVTPEINPFYPAR